MLDSKVLKILMHCKVLLKVKILLINSIFNRINCRMINKFETDKWEMNSSK